MRRPWCVVIFDRGLERTDCVWHEYARPGQTACGRHFYFTMRIEADSQPANWVHRRNAEKFARCCARCEKALAPAAAPGDRGEAT